VVVGMAAGAIAGPIVAVTLHWLFGRLKDRR